MQVSERRGGGVPALGPLGLTFKRLQRVNTEQWHTSVLESVYSRGNLSFGFLFDWVSKASVIYRLGRRSRGDWRRK